ncbi:glycolate oxidase subunit GlcE [Methylobacter sp.]|uniref:glycolate oxidase subunit GlcE n=1 Tax=Methylobacter sp. TaxID=2051955 RepID=UPI00120AFFF6|nr:glycolate oxidase subunit GlcE [Methylobacter sp.]TAK64650.1 MAG: glycolate oxidase subunit GlcE [Methylobacter sp.]
MREQDLSEDLQKQVQQAAATGTALRIVGSDSKAFYGGACQATTPLPMAGHRGIIDYEPSELVITARSGTSLNNITSLLAQHRQMLAFEPPGFGEYATLGGTLACGFSGSRRPFVGSARDFMLGCKIINGGGEVLNFGGRVMKNVAGFDVSRLMVGALGSLGVLLEVSLRVLPIPKSELTLAYTLSAGEAVTKMNALSVRPWPLSASAYDGEQLRVRLSGAQAAVQAAARQLGGDTDVQGECFWQDLREQRLTYFQQPGNLWRISVAPASASLSLSGDWFLDWGGALRWLKTEEPAEAIHAATAKVGGYAVCFRGNNKTDWIRLDPALMALQQKIRAAFDPLKLFNPGRLHR